MAVKSIWSNKLRSMLTMLGIIIGVASVIALVGLGQGTAKAVTEQVQGLGSNLLTVNIFGRGLSTALDYEQAVTLEEIDGVTSLAPVSAQNAAVKYGNEELSVNVMGTNAAYVTVQNYEVAYGRFLSQIDLDFYHTVAVLGAETAAELFGTANPVGEYVRINGKRYRKKKTADHSGDRAGHPQQR